MLPQEEEEQEEDFFFFFFKKRESNTNLSSKNFSNTYKESSKKNPNYHFIMRRGRKGGEIKKVEQPENYTCYMKNPLTLKNSQNKKEDGRRNKKVEQQ